MKIRHKIAIIDLDNWYHAFPIGKYCQSGGRLELVGVADSNKQRLEQFQREFAVPAIYKDWHQLLEKCSCEIVLVSNATFNHEEVAVEAARYGKHILCDKPITINHEAALRIMSAVKTNKVSLAMIHNFRFSPVLRTVKSLLNSGSIGNLNSLTFNCRAPLPEDWPGSNNPGWYADPSQSGGGGFVDHAAHVVDTVLWFLDEKMPTAVIGSMANLLPGKILGEDYGVAVLEFNGVTTIIESSWTAPPIIGYSEFVQIIGDQGEIFVNRSRRPYIEIRSSKDSVRLRRIEIDEPIWTDILIEVVESFLDSLEKGTPILTPGWQGVNAIRVIEAIYSAAVSGSKVIL